MKITRAEYDEYRDYQKAEANGLIITPETLRFICEAYDGDAEKIGQHIKGVLMEMRKKYPQMFKEFSFGHTPWREMARILGFAKQAKDEGTEKRKQTKSLR